MTKKGIAQMWWVIAAAIIVILMVIFLLIWFKSSGDTAFDAIGEQIEGAADSDGDGVLDLFDRCEDTPAGTEVDAQGCSENQQTPG